MKKNNLRAQYTAFRILSICFIALLSGNAIAADTDSDGIDDSVDNCIQIANANQRDTDNDGFGNACDADLNNDTVVDAQDISIFRSVYLTDDPDADFNGDGTVNILDFNIIRQQNTGTPGPSAKIQ